MAQEEAKPQSGRSGIRSYYRSSSFTTATVFVLLLSASVVFLAVYLYITSRDYFIATTVSNINALIAGITVIQDVSPRGELSAEVLERLKQIDSLVYYSLYDQDRTLITANFVMPEQVKVLVEGTILFDLANTRYDGATHKVAARVHILDNGLYLLIGRDVSQSFGRQSAVELFIWVSMGALLVLIVLSFAISSFVVRRINQITKTADQIISTGDLSQRIEVISRWDDLSHLANVLNELLQRMDELVQGARQVTNSIAHDLRTPLTHLRNNIEQLQSDEPSTAGLRKKSYEQLGSTADNLLSTFNSLLRIASIENNRRRESFALLPLHKVIEDVVDFYTPLAEERHQQVACEHCKATIMGDQHLLFQMFANLLDNAIKYSPNGSQITVKHSIEGSLSRVAVTDQGVGIEPKLRDKVFERFFRVDASRGGVGGNGLGLSLVRAIVKLHEGAIVLGDNKPGLIVAVHLPHQQDAKARRQLEQKIKRMADRAKG